MTTYDAYLIDEPVVCWHRDSECFVIERRDHEFVEWMAPSRFMPTVHVTYTSGWIAGSSVEGDRECMERLARALENGEDMDSKRCEAIRVPGGYEFSSPRNSNNRYGFVPDAHIPGLIASIRATLANPSQYKWPKYTELPRGEVGNLPELIPSKQIYENEGWV